MSGTGKPADTESGSLVVTDWGFFRNVLEVEVTVVQHCECTEVYSIL